MKERRWGGTAAALLLAACGAFGLAAGPAGAESLEQTLEVVPTVRVEIDVLSGRITLRAIDASEVRVRAAGGGVQVDGSRRRVSLRAPSSGWLPWARGADVDLEVEVPRRSRVTARIANGAIEAEGLEGELDLHAANGEIEVKGAAREAYLETMTSAIRFEGERTPVVARTLNGEIDLRGVSGDVEATSVSGRIRVQGEGIERAELRTMAGAIELDASLARGARVHARSYSGPVRLRLPEDTSARFEVQSYSGGFHSEFASRLAEDERGRAPWQRGPGRPLSFSVGDGDARVSVESFSGGVRIEQGG